MAGLFTPYIQDNEISLRITGIRDMDGTNPVERPERVQALLDVRAFLCEMILVVLKFSP